MLLSLLDDGRVTDGQGRTVDFTNVVVVMTSNLGSQFLLDAAMASDAGKPAKVRPAPLSTQDTHATVSLVDLPVFPLHNCCRPMLFLFTPSLLARNCSHHMFGLPRCPVCPVAAPAV